MVSRYTESEIAREVLELTEEELQNSTRSGLLLPSSYFAFWFFQFVFSISATAIASGAMAERVNMIAYVIYSFFMTGFIYPTVSHWCWAKSGWLKSGLGTGLSFQDFAGSGVVHMTGGTAALVGAAIIGPRTGRFHEDGTIIDYPGHSVPLTSLGGFILFTGFFAFNGGSVLTLQSPEDGVALATAITNTAVAGSGGAITAMLLSKLTDFFKGEKHYWSLLWIINGGLAGMISVCASCNDLHPWSALLIGIIAGAILIDWHYFLCYMRIDDPLDAVGVHLGGGLCGVILGPLFAVKGLKVDGEYVGGVVFGGGAWAWKNWGWNLAGASAIIVWTATCTSVLFGILSKAGIFRVSQDIEHHGSDRMLHNEPAYPKENYYADGEEGLLLREIRNND